MQEQVNIDIQIDVLQLECPGQIDAVALQREIERELSRLMTTQGVPSRWNQPHSIAEIAANWSDTTGMEDEALAANIAAAVYQALGR